MYIRVGKLDTETYLRIIRDVFFHCNPRALWVKIMNMIWQENLVDNDGGNHLF